MITVGWCTRKPNYSFRLYIQEYFNNNVEIIEKLCNEENGVKISEAFNELLAEASNDVVLLVHDNVYFINSDQYKMPVDKALEFQFNNNEEYGILGIYGRCQMEGDVVQRKFPARDYIFSEVDNDGKNQRRCTESTITKPFSLEIIDDVVIDGCLMAVKKSRLKTGFDNDNKTFHFYDLDLCVGNYINGVKVGITKAFEILHVKTENEDAKTWGDYNNIKPEFLKRWKDYLPLIVDNRPKDLILLTACLRHKNMIKIAESIEHFRDYLGNVHILWVICFDQYNIDGSLKDAYDYCNENYIGWLGFPSGKNGQKNYGGDMYNEALVWLRDNVYKEEDPWVYILDDDNLMCELMASEFNDMIKKADEKGKPCIWMSKQREDGFVDTIRSWSVYGKGKNNHATYADEFMPDPSQLIMRLSLIEKFGYFKSGHSYDQYLWWYFYEHNDLVLYPQDWIGPYWEISPSNNIFQCYHDGIIDKKDVDSVKNSIENDEPICYSIVVGRKNKIDRFVLTKELGEKLINELQ